MTRAFSSFTSAAALARAYRQFRLEIVAICFWLGILVVSSQTARERQFIGGTVAIVIAGVFYWILSAAVRVAREAERDRCVEIARAVSPAKTLNPSEQIAARHMQERIARLLQSQEVAA